jgi:hypothetical protein
MTESTSYTTWATDSNVRAIQLQIAQKQNRSMPYYATQETTGIVLTDYDTFPYPRFFRGVYNDSRPNVIEREAGWRVRQDPCYRDQRDPVLKPHPMCWQPPCTTIFPCKAKHEQPTCDTTHPIFSP